MDQPTVMEEVNTFVNAFIGDPTGFQFFVIKENYWGQKMAVLILEVKDTAKFWLQGPYRFNG